MSLDPAWVRSLAIGARASAEELACDVPPSRVQRKIEQELGSVDEETMATVWKGTLDLTGGVV